MIKSINQWSFPAGMSAQQCLLAAKEAGYEGFEPAFNEKGELSCEGFEKDAKQLRAIADAQGMQLASLASGLYWDYPLTATDAAVRQRGKEIVKRQIDCANALGVDAILVVPGCVGRGFWGGNDNVSYADAYARAQEAVAELAPYAQSAGVVIGLENVWNNFLLSPLEMARFIDDIGSSFVGVYFDIGNVIQFGEPEHWIEALGERIVRVHIKDYKRSVGTLDGFCDLMAGDVNFPVVMSALEKIGYDGPITAEMGLYAHYPMALVEQTSRAMDIILSR